MIDLGALVPLVLLVMSEIMPFIAQHDANGLIHFLLLVLQNIPKQNNSQPPASPPATS